MIHSDRFDVLLYAFHKGVPSNAISFVAIKSHGKGEPDVTDTAKAMKEQIYKTVTYTISWCSLC